MQAIPMVLMGMSAVGGIMEAKASSDNYKYQAQVAENNARLTQKSKENETFAANQDMMDKDIAAKQEIGALIAEIGASGLTASSGSMLGRVDSLRQYAAQDRERLAHKRNINSQNRDEETRGLQNEAAANRKAAKNAKIAGVLNVGTSLLQGATMVNNYKQSKAALSAPSYAKGR